MLERRPAPRTTVSEAGERLRAWAEEELAELNPGALFFEGPGDADRAIIGIATKGPGEPSVVYDEETLLATMREAFRDADSDPETVEEDAQEWLSYNTKGSWMGEGTPWVLMRAPKTLMRDLEAEERREG